MAQSTIIDDFLVSPEPEDLHVINRLDAEVQVYFETVGINDARAAQAAADRADARAIDAATSAADAQAAAEGSVRFNVAQTLDATQKAQARTNIGVTGVDGTFTTADTPAKTVTVTNGIITSIV